MEYDQFYSTQYTKCSICEFIILQQYFDFLTFLYLSFYFADNGLDSMCKNSSSSGVHDIAFGYSQCDNHSSCRRLVQLFCIILFHFPGVCVRGVCLHMWAHLCVSMYVYEHIYMWNPDSSSVNRTSQSNPESLSMTSLSSKHALGITSLLHRLE